MHNKTWDYSSLQCMKVRYIVTLHYIALLYTTEHYTTFTHIAWNCIHCGALHCIILQYMSLPCMTLHYIELHHITLDSIHETILRSYIHTWDASIHYLGGKHTYAILTHKKCKRTNTKEQTNTQLSKSGRMEALCSTYAWFLDYCLLTIYHQYEL